MYASWCIWKMKHKISLQKRRRKKPIEYYNMNHRSFIFFLNQLRQTRMWSMVPRHNRIWWRRPLVFPLQVFIQWHHTHHHKEQHIHRQMITICHIHLQAMTLWWHRQPHTFMTQSKTRPKKSNKWRLYMQITFEYVYWHLLSWLMRQGCFLNI